METDANILACTDGSTYAPSIYDHAAWAADQLGLGIHVLHMINWERDATGLHNFSGTIGVDARRTLKEELVKLEEAQGRVAQAKAEAILDGARKHFEERGFSRVRLDAKHGQLAESLEQYASNSELVIIGKRGESANFERLHLGASVERVIRTCQRPVLVASRTFRRVKRFVIAYDGGPSARKAVDYVASSSLVRGLRCDLLTVGQPQGTIDGQLEEVRERLISSGIETTLHHLDGHAEEVFSRFIETHDIDLLIMGAYGHSRIRQLIVGSTTTAMVRTCRIPVLMFR